MDLGISDLLYNTQRLCQFHNQLIDKALTSIQSGQQLDPTNSDFFSLKSQIAFYQENWEAALIAAENAFEFRGKIVRIQAFLL